MRVLSQDIKGTKSSSLPACSFCSPGSCPSLSTQTLKSQNTHSFSFSLTLSVSKKLLLMVWIRFLWISPVSVLWKRDLPLFFAGVFFLDSCLFWAPAVNSALSFPLGGSCRTPSDPGLWRYLRMTLECSLEAPFMVGETAVWSHSP